MADRFQRALAAIDAAHAQDPNQHPLPTGATVPYELHYAQQMSAYLQQRQPHASEALQLAVRAQHFQRWEVARAAYPRTKRGYHAWRAFLKTRQAAQASALCRGAGYGDAEVERIGALIRKEGLEEREDEVQALEDVACLVFLDDQFAGYEKEWSERKGDDKVVDILRKTWAKMGDRGRDIALGIPMEGKPKEVMQRALAGR